MKSGIGWSSRQRVGSVSRMRTEAATLPKCASARVPGIVVVMVVGAQHDERGGERAARIAEDDPTRMSASLVSLVALRLWLALDPLSDKSLLVSQYDRRFQQSATSTRRHSALERRECQNAGAAHPPTTEVTRDSMTAAYTYKTR